MPWAQPRRCRTLLLMSSRQTRFRELLLLTGLCGFFFFFRLSAIGLLGPDEPRYAQVAREMLERGDWVTPILYGHSWLEKPILLYWGEMLSFRLFGVSDWAARLPSAVAATLLACGSFLAVRRIRHAARLDAALMIIASVLLLGFARAASPDMLLTASWSLSLLAWYLWYDANYEPKREDAATALSAGSGKGMRRWLWLFYALNAVAALAKGPVAPALAAMVLIAFCALRRRPGALLRTLDPAGFAIFLAIAAPWYVLVQLRTPEFFNVFFLQHNLARFGSNLYRHPQPFWFYLPVALVAALPWTVWIFHGIADALTGLRNKAISRPGTDETDPPEPGYAFEIFLLTWAMVPIVFFSISHSKLPGYILPSLPALLMLAAVAVHRRDGRGEGPRWLAIASHAAVLAGLSAAACLAPQLAFRRPHSTTALMLAALAATAVFLLTALPLLSRWGWRYLHFVTLLPVVLIVGYILRGLGPALDATQSARPVARLIQQSGTPGSLSVATFGLSRRTAFGLSFYLNHRVDPYEGLEISPAVVELPPSVPSAEHLLVAREGSLASLRLLLAGRRLTLLATYPAQQIELFQVSAMAGSHSGAMPGEDDSGQTLPRQLE